MQVFQRFGGIALLAGFFCYFFAFGLIVFAPLMLTDASDATVIDVNGNRVAVAPYTPAEAAGRQVYIDNVCWHCHSQFVRPVNDEDERWGPVSQAGESALDRPHLFGTRRIGPDLAREGGARVDDWQIGHLYDPRATVAASVMPSFPWLFRDYTWAEEIQSLIRDYDQDGDGIVSKFDEEAGLPPIPDEAKTRMRAPRLDVGGVLHPDYRQAVDGADVRDGSYAARDAFTGTDGGDNLLSLYDQRPRPTQEALDLVAYLQRLGTSIGLWRQPLAAVTPVRAFRPPMVGVTATWRDAKGDSRESAVEDGQMPLRAREARRYGAAWERATKEERDLVTDLRTEYAAVMAAWRKANPAWARRLDEGAKLYTDNCASCHGPEGRGNGPASPHLLVTPRDFTGAAYRYRSTQVGNKPLDGDLFRSIWRGLPGTAMPPWREFSEEDIWLLVDYVQSFQETIGVDERDRGKPFNDAGAALTMPPVPSPKAADLPKLLARGRAVYVAMKCSNCHGTEGRGDGPGWNTTTKDNGGLVRPRDFRPQGPGDQPALRYRGGALPQDIYRTIFTGLEGTGMPSSMEDFQLGLRLADKLDELERAKAPAEEIEKAKTAARRRLIVSLGDDPLGKAMFGEGWPEGGPAGMVREKDEIGADAEYLDRFRRTEGRRIGDDWAVVFYTMHLSGIPIPTAR